MMEAPRFSTLDLVIRKVLQGPMMRACMTQRFKKPFLTIIEITIIYYDSDDTCEKPCEKKVSIKDTPKSGRRAAPLKRIPQ